MKNKYQILTKEGYVDFDGIRQMPMTETMSFVMDDNSTITVSLNHKFVIKNREIIAHTLTIGDWLESENSLKMIIDIHINKPEFVYDILNVQSIDHTYYANDILNHNCEFNGSSTTLLRGQTLSQLSVKSPIHQNEYLRQFELPVKNKEKPLLNHTYFMTCDVSRGKGLDYSTFSVFDISVIPYNQVCTFRCNTITPYDFAVIINNIGKMYNDAYVLVELNDLGEMVSTHLRVDLDYENLVAMTSKGRGGQRISGGFGKVNFGITTSTPTKKVGCSLLKLLVEQNKIQINDVITIKELMVFQKEGESYSAPTGSHDDMVMTLVTFAYVTQDPYFIGYADVNIMSMLRDQTNEQIEEDLVPFGVVNNALDDLNPKYVKFEGEKGVWQESDSFEW